MKKAMSLPPARTKPRLRGVSHEIAAYLSIPVLIGLVAMARSDTGVAAAATYGTTLVLLFAASALYHRPHWRPRPRNILGRVDQAAIFLLIAGTYTPICLVLRGAGGRALLAAVWTLALAGVVLSLRWAHPPKRLMAAIYVLLGWLVLPLLPALWAAIRPGPFLLLMLGGLFYTVGAGVYAFRRPDPIPAVFGYHEVFHVLVVGAAACHATVAGIAIRSLG